MSFTFLTTKHVLEIQQEQIDLYGGEHGVRDLALVESAVATPRYIRRGIAAPHCVRRRC